MDGYPERLPACHCWQNARRMAELHPELAIVRGYLVFPRPEPFEDFRLAHGWNLAPDGTIVDATAWAYAGQSFSYEPAPGERGVPACRAR
jgi:hypothetical protein